jgi:4-amino-4-deoxy-L-arabinose transferase-like glycosyltransferase
MHAPVRAIVLLVLFSLLTFLPGQFQIPPIDRDEARYAQATRQMLETGDYLDIRFQDQPRYLQPIGIYWLQAAAAKASGFDARAPIGIHRLPSLLGATTAVVFTYWALLPLAGPAGALIAAMLLTVSVLLGVEARLAKTDAVLLAATVAAMGMLARAYLGRIRTARTAVTFWIALSAGVLVKGPIILLVVGLTTVTLCAWDRSVSWLGSLHPLKGVGVLLLLVVPWFIAIAMVSGDEFFVTAIGHNLWGKVTTGQQGHGAPPGTYLALFWLTCGPAALFTISAAPWAWRQRHQPAVRFCLAWILPTWLVFELIVTKLPHYVLPTYPAIVGLIALALIDGRRLGRVPGALLVAGSVAFVGAAAAALYVLGGQIAPFALLLSLAAIAAQVWTVRAEPMLSPVAVAAVIALSSSVILSATFGWVVPRLDALWLSPRIAAAVERHAPCAKPQVMAIGYHEPSVVFLVGTDTHLAWISEGVRFLAEGGCRLAVVAEDSEPAFAAQVVALDRAPVLAERVSGYNLGRFGRLSVGVYRVPSP